MVSSLFPGGSAVSAVRVPMLAVSFGSGSADDWQNTLESLTLAAGLAPHVDRVELYLAAVQDAPVPAVGDTGSLALGYADGPTALVFTGQVEAVRHAVHGAVRITAVNGGAALAKLRVNQSYEQQPAGDIVNELAGRASVSTDTVENGVDLPFYVVDDRLSAYRQVAALARRSGYIAFFTPGGGLSFAPFAGGQPVQTFTYGMDILELHVRESSAMVSEVVVSGEGAAGSQGQEAWSWLVKDLTAVKKTAGQGTPRRDIQDPALRSAEAVQSAADGSAAAASTANVTGSMLVPGAPLVVVGSAVEVTAAPQEALNGTFMVRQVRHRYAKRQGFTTLMTLSKAGAGGGLGGLL